MNWFSLFPDEHIYSGLIRYRMRMGQGFMTDKRFFEHNGLPYHRFSSQAPLNHLMCQTISVIEPESNQQFGLRLNHTPFSPWLLSLPEGMEPNQLIDAKKRPSTEETPYQVDRRWRYCPICLETQRKRLGIGYWKASHHLPGALVCNEHNVALHSHDELRYLNHKLPHKWKDFSSPVLLDEDWKVSWQPFIYGVAKLLQQRPEQAIEIRENIYQVLDLPKHLRHGDKAVVESLFAQMCDDLGEACLKGLFSAYARQYKKPTNILWVTLSPWGSVKGVRHPLYWLSIMFWLKEDLRSLDGIYENSFHSTF